MKDQDIHDEWLTSIDLSKTRVINTPSLILLCGGEISDNGTSFKSCRDIFYRYILDDKVSFRKKVVLAEKVFRYFEHSHYQDLLMFERDLAEFCELIVLFSESPGSIAEFGSFAVLETIQDRLLVVMHREDADKKSFIWQGPALFLKHLAKKKKRQDPISVYYWRRKTSGGDALNGDDFYDAKDLGETIENIILKSPKTEALNPKLLGHVMLLTIELIDVVRIATFDEIIYLLKKLKIDSNRRTLKQYLSLTNSLKYSDKIRYGNNAYYVSRRSVPWLSWGFSEKAKIRDIDRWKNRFVEHYTNYNKQKRRALRSYMRSEKLVGV